MRYKKNISILILIVMLFSNRTYAQFSRYHPNDKPTVAVLDFKLFTKGSITDDEVLVLSSKFRSSLIQTEKYQVLERKNMEEILEEQNLSLQDYTSCNEGKCAIELGELLSAQRVIIGDIGKVGKTFSVTVKIIDAETGEIIQTKDIKYKGKRDGLIKEFKKLACKLTGTCKSWWRWSNVWNYVIGVVLGGAGYYGYNEFIKPDPPEDNSLPEPPMP